MTIKLTKNQALILALLFSHPKDELYMREIGRLLGKEPGVFQRDINELEEKGIILSRYQAKSRFFKINTKHHLYRELKSIIFKTIGIGGSLRDAFKKIKGIKKAFIYGSFAQGKEDSQSDIDLIIIGRPDQNDLIENIKKIEKRFGREINYVIFSQKEFLTKKNEPFLRDILENKKIVLIDDEKNL